MIERESIDDLQADCNRELRLRRIKKALAWCGVVAVGSLAVFVIGVFCFLTDKRVVLVMLAVIGLMIWANWGFDYLKKHL